MKYKLEVIGFTIESCGIAQAAGAHRIELCDNPGEGGTTPSYGFIRSARENLSIELYPIIRPRGGDFLYSDASFDIMKKDVAICRDLGCDGIVTGILQEDGRVDKTRCSRLVELAYPMGVTFHRAFDRTNDAYQALEDIIDIGCERILSSGTHPTAILGMDTLTTLIKQAADRIIVMPGSAVRSDNIIELANKTGAIEFHSSARIMAESMMQYANASMNEKLQAVTVDKDEIALMLKLLNSIKESGS